MESLIIRSALAGDVSAVCQLLTAAFSGEQEAHLVSNLAARGDLSMAIVAEAGGAVVGFLACSPLVLDGSDAEGHALAPVAVEPSLQGGGIGAALIEAAHMSLRKRGADFILVLGDPAYYGRFGYSALAATGFETPYDGPYLQALFLSDKGMAASGKITYSEAFQRLGEDQ